MMRVVHLEIRGMACGHCMEKVKRILSGYDGVTQVTVDLENKRAEVTYDDSLLNSSDLVKAINETEIYQAKIMEYEN